VTPADIEAFYDYRAKGVDVNTAYLDIRGLKKFFEGVKNLVPFYKSPFDEMKEKLIKKLNKTKKGNRTKKALSQSEVKKLLAWLSENKTVRGLEDHSIVYMLVTSGLRAGELSQLRWRDIEYFEGKWTAVFIGKGGKVAEQELYGPAVEACKEYFKKAFRRDPGPEDALFWTLPTYNGEKSRVMPYHTLWRRITVIGRAARELGILKRDIEFSPHLFRRSYATCLYKAGMGIRAIQEKTRHSNITTLTKHYIHDDDAASPYLAKMLV
jgi:integrase/recombinase XerD